MTKTDIIEAILKNNKITRVKAELIVNTVFDSMKGALQNNERVEIRDFGSFEVRKYEAYSGRNPKTGEVIEVKRKRAPFFKVGKNLKSKVNKKSTIIS